MLHGMRSGRGILWLACASLLILVLPLTLSAQDAPPAFVTNTPAAPGGDGFILATNTPSGGAPSFQLPTLAVTATPTASPTPIPVPQALVEAYALPLWTEARFTTMLADQIRQIPVDAADDDAVAAVRLLTYEYGRRFPSAPSTAAGRAELIGALLAAPPGTVDLRRVMTGVIADALNAQQPLFDATTRFDRDGFTYELTAFNLDNANGLDAVVQVTYPVGADAAARLLDLVVVARVGDDGRWSVPPAAAGYPVAPFAANVVRVAYVGDLTGDAQSEVAVSVDRGELNTELRVLGWRGDRVVDLTQPNTTIRYGELPPLDGATASIDVQVYQIAAPRWDCIAAQRVTWTYDSNFFRPLFDAGGFRPQPTLACTFSSLDPLYEQPLGRAIASVEALLTGAARDEAGFIRGQMALAMLYALDGQTDLAVAQMQVVRDAANGSAWVTAQTDAFFAAAEAGLPPVAWCGAVQASRVEAGDAVCAVDEVLTRLWAETPPRRDQPLAAQISALGGSVRNQFTVREVGRLDREVVQFDLGGEHWWSFAPLQTDTYTAEPIDPVIDPNASVAAPTVIAVPSAVLTALEQADDPAAALTLIESALREGQVANPEAVPSPALSFARALMLDLLGDRIGARAGYYAVWETDPASAWGRAAAAHLERR